MALSYNVQNLENYVDERREGLLAESILGAKSASLFNLMTGVKGPTALNIINTEVEFGDGSVCGWDEDGISTLSQRVLTPRALKVNMAICDKVLLSKWANYLVRVEAGKTDRDLPFEQEFIDTAINDIKAKLERMIWMGDSTDTAAIEFDGIWKILDDEVTPTDMTGVTTAWGALKKILMNIPANVIDKEDLVMFVDMGFYTMFIQELVTANLYHYDPADGENMYKLPGTSIRVIAVPGLNDGTVHRIIAARLSNLVYGINLADGEEIFDLWYSKDNREFRFVVEFVAGTQIAFPDEVTYAEVTFQ